MKKDWEDKRVHVKDLNLDLQNPRVPKHVKDLKDVGLIRNHLIDKEDVLRIAESITHNGYHRSVTTITCKEDGNLVVLDGNRRLAACQLLLDPTLAPNASIRKRFEQLSEKSDKTLFANIKITVAPSRKEAEKEIWDIHVNALLKPWQVLQKLRMYRNLIDNGEYDVNQAAAEYHLSPGDFKGELAKLHFYEQILEQNPTAEDVLLESGFNKIDRLILSKNGKKFLGYSVDDIGDVIVSDGVEHVKRLKKLTPYIIEPEKVGAQANQEWIEKKVFAVLDPSNFSAKTPKVKKTKKAKGIKTVPPKCFVIMPLAGLDSVYETIQSAWRAVFGNKAKVYHQADDGDKGGKELIDKKILKNIRTATVVVGIFSMGSKERKLYDSIPKGKREAVFEKSFPFNMNVALEVGYAVRSAESETDSLKDYFLIADGAGKHSAYKFLIDHCFDLGHRDVISYAETELEKLKTKLASYFEKFKFDNGL